MKYFSWPDGPKRLQSSRCHWPESLDRVVWSVENYDAYFGLFEILLKLQALVFCDERPKTTRDSAP